jgi:hypothetical protein
MPRYIVERTFPDGLRIGADVHSAAARLARERNRDHGVTWLYSYVTDDGARTFCVYDAPSPEAIRKTAARNSLPVDRIIQVLVLDPYSYRGEMS